MNKKKAICKLLQIYHVGKENAVHSKVLERKLGLNGRTIRRIISSLRQEGFPICSDESGYYFADTQQEINKTVSRLNELVTKISNARTGLLFSTPFEEANAIVEFTIKFI